MGVYGFYGMLIRLYFFRLDRLDRMFLPYDIVPFLEIALNRQTNRQTTQTDRPGQTRPDRQTDRQLLLLHLALLNPFWFTSTPFSLCCFCSTILFIRDLLFGIPLTGTLYYQELTIIVSASREFVSGLATLFLAKQGRLCVVANMNDYFRSFSNCASLKELK